MSRPDQLDKELLNFLQEGLPLESRPFLDIADKLDITEEEVIQRVQQLKSEKIIRRLGGIWDSRKLGFTSTLVALKVNPHYLEKVASQVNLYSGVTHNYQREHSYNLWFTLAAENTQQMNRILNEIGDLEGVENLIKLPAIKQFKVEVKFNLKGDQNAHR